MLRWHLSPASRDYIMTGGLLHEVLGYEAQSTTERKNQLLGMVHLVVRFAMSMGHGSTSVPHARIRSGRGGGLG